MISLEDELALARDAVAIAPDAAARLIAEERRDLFSLFGELRAASYIAVALVTTGVGLWLKANAQRLGPVTIVAALLVVAAGCYLFALRRPLRSIVDDYVLLLGALLLSAAAGYAESQFHMLGANWSRHFLFLALIHIASAYVFDSRLVLTAGLASLAAWFGVEKTLRMPVAMGMAALLCAALILSFRLLNRHRPFDEVYEHAAASLAFAGALSWSFDHDMRWWGVAIALLLAFVVVRWGLHTSSESFVMYAVVGATVAVDVSVIAAFDRYETDTLIALYLLASSVAVIVLLFAIHVRMKERR